MSTILILSIISHRGRAAAGFVPSHPFAISGVGAPLISTVISMNLALALRLTTISSVVRGGAQKIRIVTSANKNGQIKASF